MNRRYSADFVEIMFSGDSGTNEENWIHSTQQRPNFKCQFRQRYSRYVGVCTF